MISGSMVTPVFSISQRPRGSASIGSSQVCQDVISSLKVIGSVEPSYTGPSEVSPEGSEDSSALDSSVLELSTGVLLCSETSPEPAQPANTATIMSSVSSIASILFIVMDVASILKFISTPPFGGAKTCVCTFSQCRIPVISP